jgi:hypothetical protein
MSPPISRIQNSELVTSWFGYWPSFHDAEVLELVLARHGADGSPSVSVAVHTFEMTNETTPDGYFVCRKHAVVTLLFEGLDEVALEGFNHQNALSGLSITELQVDGPMTVIFDSAYGLDSELKCQRIKVVSVVPGIPPESVYSRPTA